MFLVKIKNFFRDIPQLAPLAKEYRYDQRYAIANTSTTINNCDTDEMGEVINVSMTGMAFHHPANISQEKFVLDIIAEKNVIVTNINCSLVWRKPAFSGTKYGVHFEELTHEQETQLDRFIQDHCNKQTQRFVSGLPR